MDKKKVVDSMTDKEKLDHINDQKQKYDQKMAKFHQSTYGSINDKMMCPHCQSLGKVRTKKIEKKKGISGGKAVASVLTGGLSLLAVGISRKEDVTQAHCDNCENNWYF
jgi:hypothetical protein